MGDYFSAVALVNFIYFGMGQTQIQLHMPGAGEFNWFLGCFHVCTLAFFDLVETWLISAEWGHH